jgi:hypothetical protein
MSGHFAVAHRPLVGPGLIYWQHARVETIPGNGTK